MRLSELLRTCPYGMQHAGSDLIAVITSHALQRPPEINVEMTKSPAGGQEVTPCSAEQTCSD